MCINCGAKKIAAKLQYNGTPLLISLIILPCEILHCVSKNDTDVAHYNFDADQSILIIFSRDVAEGVCCQTLIRKIPPLLTSVFAQPGET